MTEEIDPPAEETTAPAVQPNAARTWLVAGVASLAVLGAGVFGVKAFAQNDKADANTLNASANSPTGSATVRQFGNAGKITQIDGDSFTLQTTDFNGNTSTVKVSTDSKTKFRDTVKGAVTDLKVGQTIIANGTTADGVLTAERISQADEMRRLRSSTNGSGADGPRQFSGAQAPPMIQNGQTPSGNVSAGGPPADGSFAAGKITKIDGDTITISDNDGTSKTIKATSSTTVMVTKTIKLSNLKVGDDVRVGGETKNGVLPADTVTRGEVGGAFFRAGPGLQQTAPTPIQGSAS